MSSSSCQCSRRWGNQWNISVLAFAVPILDCVFAIFRRTMCGRSPFPRYGTFSSSINGKRIISRESCTCYVGDGVLLFLVAIASAFGKGDQLFAVFVFFGLGGFILLRYLGYFRFEFFGEGLSTLIEDRKSTKTVEQAIKEAEYVVTNAKSLEDLKYCLGKAAVGMQFHEAKISFFNSSNHLGVDLNEKNPKIGKTIRWVDREQVGYYSRDKEFCVEFSISGRNFTYGKAEYLFMDGRSSLSVQDEVFA